jgi:hypothetical protein
VSQGRAQYVPSLMNVLVDTVTDERTPLMAGGSWRDVVADAREVEIHWREAQYHLGDVAKCSEEAARLRAEMQRLRDEYARLIEEARRHGRELAHLTYARRIPQDPSGIPMLSVSEPGAAPRSDTDEIPRPGSMP